MCTFQENIVYLTPDAIREFFDGWDDEGVQPDLVGRFVYGADESTLRDIGNIAYVTESMWDAVTKAVRDAATYVYNKQEKENN